VCRGVPILSSPEICQKCCNLTLRLTNYTFIRASNCTFSVFTPKFQLPDPALNTAPLFLIRRVDIPKFYRPVRKCGLQLRCDYCLILYLLIGCGEQKPTRSSRPFLCKKSFIAIAARDGRWGKLSQSGCCFQVSVMWSVLRFVWESILARSETTCHFERAAVIARVRDELDTSKTPLFAIRFGCL